MPGIVARSKRRRRAVHAGKRRRALRLGMRLRCPHGLPYQRLRVLLCFQRRGERRLLRMVHVRVGLNLLRL